jgi:hypothetical protein
MPSDLRSYTINHVFHTSGVNSMPKTVQCGEGLAAWQYSRYDEPCCRPAAKGCVFQCTSPLGSLRDHVSVVHSSVCPTAHSETTQTGPHQLHAVDACCSMLSMLSI